MKQFFAIAGLFAVLSVSAQQRPERPLQDQKGKQEMRDLRRDGKQDFKDKKRPSIDQKMQRYDKYELSSVQKQKIKALHEGREKDKRKDFDKKQKEFAKQRDADRKKFDQKLEQIMGKKQFAQYKQDRDQQVKKRGEFKRGKEFRDFDKVKRG